MLKLTRKLGKQQPVSNILFVVLTGYLHACKYIKASHWGKQNTYEDQVAVNTSSRLRATNPFRCRCNIGGSHFWLTKKITCIEAKYFVKCQIALSSRGKHLKHTRVEQVELQIVNRNTEWEPSNRKLWHHISYWLIASFKTMTLCIWAKRVRINSFRNSRIRPVTSRVSTKSTVVNV